MEVKNVIVSILTLLCMTTAGYAQGVKSDDAVKSIKTQPATEGIKVQSQTINPVVSAALIGGKEMRLVNFGDWISGLLQHRKNLKKNKTTAPKTSAAPSILERFSAASGRENKTMDLGQVANKALKNVDLTAGFVKGAAASGRENKTMDLGQVASKALKNVDLTAGIVKGAANSGRENKASQLGAFIASASHQEEVTVVKNPVNIPDMAETLMQEKANLDNAVKGVKAATASPIFNTKDANAIALGQTLSAYFAKSKQANEKQKVQNLSNISAESKEFYDALLANGKYHELASVIIAVDHTAQPAVVDCNGKKYSYKGKVNDSEVLYVLYSIKKNIAQHTCQKGGCLICNSVMSTSHKGHLVYGVASKVKTDLIASAE